MLRQLRLKSWVWALVLGLLALGQGGCRGWPVLQEDQQLERHLRQNERHRYRILVPDRHLVEILVTPLDDQDLDLVVWVFGSSFRRPLPLDGYPNTPDRAVRWLLASSEGQASYRLEVRTESGTLERYSIVVKAEPLQSGDLARAAAVKRVAEGLRLEQLARDYDARENYRGAAATWRLLGERLEMGRNLRRAARSGIEHQLGREVLKDCEPAIAVFREFAEAQAEGETLNLCARVYRRLGENRQARESYDRALVLAKRNGLSNVEVDTYHNLAVLLSEQGEYEAADLYYREALRLDRSQGALSLSLNQPKDMAEVLTWQCWIHSRNGEFPAAVER